MGEVSLTEPMGDTLLPEVTGATQAPSCELRALETKDDLAEGIEAEVVRLPIWTVESFSVSEDLESLTENGAQGLRNGPVAAAVTKTGADAEGAKETLVMPWATRVGVPF
mmetsp:Transcript_19985/g.35465  ORF Transcript_19985/g.35465 Transcript_19985/m.35465 type:complete len:110 (-) Transcript_19985:389-718(-)